MSTSRSGPVLGIETSTLNACVAVVAPGGDVLAEVERGGGAHAEVLLDLVAEALDAAGVALDDLAGVAVGAGPGSFTGLRIGMATAKGLAFAADKPLWAVSSLAAVAWDRERREASGDALLVPILDARRKEIFIGFYRVDDGRPVAVADEQVMPPGSASGAVREVAEAGSIEQVIAVGEGLVRYSDVLDRDLRDIALVDTTSRATPSASSVALLAFAGTLPDVLAHGTPVYVRPSEAELKFPDGNPGGTFAPIKK